LLRDLLSHSALSEDDRQAVRDLPTRLRKLDPGSYLIREGDVPTHCSVLVSGFAIRLKVTGEGSRQIMAVCIPGDAIDFQNLFLGISDHAIQILTRSVIADIPREPLQELLFKRPAISAAVIHSTLIEASMAYSVRPCAETSEALLELMSASPPEALVAALRAAVKA